METKTEQFWAHFETKKKDLDAVFGILMELEWDIKGQNPILLIDDTKCELV